MAQKRYLFTPGPTPVPPQVLAALAEPVLHHRAPDFREVYARARAAAGGAPDGERRAPLHLLRDRRVRVGDRQPLLAGRARARRLGRPLRRALGGDGADVRLRGRGAPLRLGRDADARRPRAQARRDRARSRSSSSSTRRRRPASSPTSRRSPPSRRRPGALVVVDAVSSLGAVPLEMDDWGPRRRRLRLAEGADDAARARDRRRLRRRPGSRSRARRCRASTSTGSGRARRRRSSTAPSRPPSR